METNILIGHQPNEKFGDIPIDWRIYSIQELIDKKHIVGHLDGNHGELYPSSDEFTEIGIPYIGANDFSKGYIDYKSCKYLPEERAKLFKKGVAKDGDVLFAHNATVGPVALIETKYEYVILSTTATYFRCNNEKLLNIFLLYTLQSPFFVNQYQSVMAQSTRNQVPVTVQRKFRLLLSPLSEQTAIAQSLSDVDALITECDRIIAKKRNTKQGTMQQLLTGKKRLPGFGEEQGYKQTEIGMIPDDWNVLDIADIVENNRVPSGIYKEKNLYGKGIKIIKLSDVFNLDYFDPANAKRVILNDNELLSYRVRVGDIFIALASVKLEGVGKVMLVTELDEETAYDHNLALIRANGVIDAKFLFYMLKSNLVRRKISKLSTQVGTTFLKSSTILKFQLPIPAVKVEQASIATLLSDMDTEIAGLEQKRDKYKAIKQGMMQELLTGKTRLISSS